jgi:lysophospholipase L1-like esterase
MKTLLCFGDSNTHGTIPMQTREEVTRYPFEQRWPGVVQAALGSSWRILEEGLPGRTTSRDDMEEGKERNALRYWQACLQTHRPVDGIVIMLGVNDLKAKFDASPESIALGVKALIGIARDNTPPGHNHLPIWVVTPAPILEVGFFTELFAGGAAKSQGLATAFEQALQMPGVHLLHAEHHCAVSAVDGIHFDAVALRQLGLAIAAAVTAPAADP